MWPSNRPTSPREVDEISSIQQQITLAPKSLLNSVHPVFPLRGLEERGSPLTDVPARNLERMSVADRTVALLSMLAYDLDLQERVSDWLENLIDRRIKVPLLPGKRVSLLSVPPRQKGGDSRFTNEGTGSNQLPFILVPIGLAPPGETILLTEPEAHLHPKLQSTLTSLLLDLSRSENRQFVIETHSEHVLHRVLNAVAKGELATSDLAIYYFERTNEISKCRRLEVSSTGQVDGGLPGFFEQSVNELSEYLDAVKKN
jgi:predicted ATPase